MLVAINKQKRLYYVSNWEIHLPGGWTPWLSFVFSYLWAICLQHFEDFITLMTTADFWADDKNECQKSKISREFFNRSHFFGSEN